MQNKISCPHCDKEITTLKMVLHSAKQAVSDYTYIRCLVLFPFLHMFSNPILSLPMIWILPVFDTRIDGKEMVVTGIISNLTDSAWTSVSVEVEFYDEGGNFIGESDDYIGSEIHSKANENFEVRFRNLPEVVLQGDASTKLKIAGGVCKNF